MPDPRMLLATLLGAYFPHLADNRPTLDAWSAELLETHAEVDVLEESIRRVARSVRWVALADILEEVRAVKSERYDSAGIAALPEERTWTEADEAAARAAADEAFRTWRANHPPSSPQTGQERPRVPTPGEDYFEPQEPAQDPERALTQEEPKTDDA